MDELRRLRISLVLRTKEKTDIVLGIRLETLKREKMVLTIVLTAPLAL